MSAVAVERDTTPVTVEHIDDGSAAGQSVTLAVPRSKLEGLLLRYLAWSSARPHNALARAQHKLATTLFRLGYGRFDDDMVLTTPLGVVMPQGLSKSFPIRMIPPRGPRSVLCVVEVTTWAYSSGLLSNPAAISPAGCAMSIISNAPTLSAISLIRL